MEIDPNKIYIVFDKNIDMYMLNNSIISYFDDEEHAKKECEKLNLKHYLEFESSNSEIESRYKYMTLSSTIEYISNITKSISE